MNSNNRIANAIISIVLGVLLILKKGEVISILTTVLGIAVLIMAILDLTKGKTAKGIVEIVMAAVVLIFGWFFVSIAIYVISAVIIVSSALDLIDCYKAHKAHVSYLVPILGLAAGVCLFFNQGGAVAIVFTLTGILLIVRGVLNIIK